MALPAFIQTTGTFNTWFDATNNVISYLVNSSALLQISQNATPATSTGNAALDGTLSLSSLSVNASTLLTGLVNVSANITASGTTNFTGPVTITSTTLGVTGNATFSGSWVNVSSGFLRVTGNVVFSNVFGVVGATTLSNTLMVQGAANLASLGVVGGASFANTLTVTGGWANVTGLNVSGLATFLANVSTNASVTLSGPFGWGAGFVLTPSALSGPGPFNDLANNISGFDSTTIYRVASDQATAITGLYVADATKFREVTLVNVGNYDITLRHANSLSVSNNQFYCPANTDAVLVTQGSVVVSYDATSSKWRIKSGSATFPLANTTTNGAVSFSGSQVFAGAKTFTGNVTLSAMVSITGNVSMSNSVSLSGGATCNSTFNLNSGSGRLVLPVGANLYA